jgi:hypothetical protein
MRLDRRHQPRVVVLLLLVLYRMRSVIPAAADAAAAAAIRPRALGRRACLRLRCSLDGDRGRLNLDPDRDVR